MAFNFAENEKNILKFWQDNKIFEKLRKKNQNKKNWSFLDGPITANNPMGVHHAWGRTYKDVFQRYKSMQGFDQRFQNGFDCQGLWVEVEVEKELGFRNKKDIENFGIDKFVEKCKARVMKYSDIQTEQSIRLGQWMDWQNSYFTMSDENNYAIWNFLKKCHEKKLLYKGRDVVPWCPRCGTAISQHEILTEEYKEITHKAVYVKFPVAGEKNTYFLAWTTTPWTLPGNVALAVHPDFKYSKVKAKDGNFYILLSEKVKDIIGDCEEIETIVGGNLITMKYQGIFDELERVRGFSNEKPEHNVFDWKDITMEEGTGIVHMAPGCGEEDFKIIKRNMMEVINVSDDESKYREGFGELTGKFVGSNEVREWILNNLTDKNRVYKIEEYKHRYPTCWRCKSELIFRLVDEWYVSMDSLRKSLMDSVKKIKWIPSFGLDRELDWLKNMSDWLISKKRYWGLALPIWECKECSENNNPKDYLYKDKNSGEFYIREKKYEGFLVIGSKEELKEKTEEGWNEFIDHSPHRPWVDNIKIKCPNSKCGKLMSRIPDVGNPWLDAGIVPFSTMGYFSDKKYWKKWFPADFICESFPGQFKNWFYSILVMSQVLEKRAPFKTLLGYASVVDEKGEEMHKSKGNAIWFDEAVEKIGADVMRWMYARQNPVNNMKFGYNIAKETERKLLTLLNCYTFFRTYSSKNNVSSFKFQVSKNILDKWILSRLNGLIGKATESLDEYDIASASEAIESFFVNDLSLWHIRRSRKRFQNPASETEKSEAEQVLYYVLLALTKLIAPIMPFFSEKMYQELKSDKMPESVHFCEWPEADKKMIDEKLEEEMEERREITSDALAKRIELGIKIRQPLEGKIRRPKSLKVMGLTDTASIVADEINMKYDLNDPKKIFGEETVWETEISEELKQEGQIREFIRQVQEFRKRAGLIPCDKIKVFYISSLEFRAVLEKNKEKILKETKAEEITYDLTLLGESTHPFEWREIEINEEKISIFIKKISLY